MPQEKANFLSWKPYLKAGTEHTQHQFEFIKIYAANATGYVTVFAGLLFGIIAYFEEPVLSIYPFSGFLVSLLALYGIKKGRHRLGRFLIAVWIPVSNAFCHAHAVADGEGIMPAFYFSQIAFSLISWVIFDSRERSMFIVAIAINLTFITFQPLFNGWYEPPEQSSLATNSVFNALAYVIAIFSFVGCLVSFITQNLRSEGFIKQKNKEIEHQNAALINQKETLQQIVNDIQQTVEAAVSSGDFNQHIHFQSHEEEWLRLSTVINNLFQSMAEPSKVISKIVDHMASGDLSHRYEAEAKGDIEVIKHGFNQALQNLNQLLNEVNQETNRVSTTTQDMIKMGDEMQSTTTQITTTISEISNGSHSQLQQIDRSSQLLETLVGTSAETGKKAQEILKKANIGVQMSHEGLKMIEGIELNMHQIMENSSHTSASVQSLANRSKEITQVLTIIEEIASQTNLLALNAAIEAAQAGESGRGFAVVAQEIRRLAEESKQSIQEISQLIMGIQSEVQTTYDHIQGMKSSIQIGKEATAKSVTRFHSIEIASKETLSHTEEIVQATNQQHQGLHQIMTSIEGVVIIAEETAAGTAQAAHSSTEMANGMTSYVEKSKEVVAILRALQEKLQRYQLARGD